MPRTTFHPPLRRLYQHTTVVAPAEMPLKLTYMAVRARAEATRMILAYAGIEYEFVNLTTRKAIAEAKSLRTTASAAKGGRDDLYMTWGQLPVLELDDGTSFTQSGSVVRAAAKLAGLYPADIGQVRRCAHIGRVMVPCA